MIRKPLERTDFPYSQVNRSVRDPWYKKHRNLLMVACWAIWPPSLIATIIAINIEDPWTGAISGLLLVVALGTLGSLDGESR